MRDNAPLPSSSISDVLQVVKEADFRWRTKPCYFSFYKYNRRKWRTKIIRSKYDNTKTQHCNNTIKQQQALVSLLFSAAQRWRTGLQMCGSMAHFHVKQYYAVVRYTFKSFWTLLLDECFD